MIMSIRVGSNDVAKARAFYDATFTALGGEPTALPAGAPMGMYRLPGGPVFLVGGAADGAPATFANGGTILLIAQDEAAVDAWHAAGLANGGGDEGAPGHRERPNRYGAYLRDPDGNKFGCYVGNIFG
ncbi:VOC family protein [Sphingomonas solaris]|uniref:VOC family protein n=1 Tax=Alterirhizorhabdus solaris TaxID=2529389 RepID=A0A558QX80_9SPHN|nr:VOC family protein [Sphingomonas solaris]TVV71708.1 VOC family protein [Sphingomonas solaris]